MFFVHSLQELATPTGIAVLVLSLASGLAAAVYCRRLYPEPSTDDLRIMSATEARIILRLAPMLAFILGAVVPWLAWPTLIAQRGRSRRQRRYTAG